MRLTSLEVYERIKERGYLPRMKLEVFLFVCKCPGCTSLDAEKTLLTKNYSSVAARFGELVDLGLIKSAGTREQDGANRTVYEITGSLEPTNEIVLLREKLTRKEAKISRLYAEAGAIRNQIAKLTGTNQLSLI